MEPDDILSGMPRSKRVAGGRRLLACLGCIPLPELTAEEVAFVLRQQIDRATDQCWTRLSGIVGETADGK